VKISSEIRQASRVIREPWMVEYCCNEKTIYVLIYVLYNNIQWIRYLFYIILQNESVLSWKCQWKQKCNKVGLTPALEISGISSAQKYLTPAVDIFFENIYYGCFSHSLCFIKWKLSHFHSEDIYDYGNLYFYKIKFINWHIITCLWTHAAAQTRPNQL
jgi:hypothetical protein